MKAKKKKREKEKEKKEKKLFNEMRIKKGVYRLVGLELVAAAGAVLGSTHLMLFELGIDEICRSGDGAHSSLIH